MEEETLVFPIRLTNTFNLKEQVIETLKTLCEQFESSTPSIEETVKQLTNLRNRIKGIGNNGQYATQIETIDYLTRRFQENPTPALYIIASRIISQDIHTAIFNNT